MNFYRHGFTTPQWFSENSSFLLILDKQVLDEHLLFQRRFRRKMCSLIQKTERRFSAKAEAAFFVDTLNSF